MLIDIILSSGYVIKGLVWEKNLEDLKPLVTQGDYDKMDTIILSDRDKNSYIIMVKDIQAIKFIPIKCRIELN